MKGKMFISSGFRTFLITSGIILGWIASGFLYQFQEIIINETVRWIFYVFSIIFTMVGCYIWSRLKNRHWGFMFWGLLSPIGLLGISLLKDRSQQKEVE